MRIAVAGGTGVVGQHVVAAARRLGHEPVVLSRSSGVDLTTGAGLDAAMDGVDAVVDVSNTTAFRRAAATEFFTSVSRRLLVTGVPHVVTLSIVGCDRVDFGYYLGKRAQEAVVLADPRGSVLRATQFHEFARQTVERSRIPLVAVPLMRSQTIAAAEVGAALVELAASEGRGLAPELAGPEVHQMVALVRRYGKAARLRRLVYPVAMPGKVGKGMAGGGLLPTGEGPRGTTTYDEWLANHTRSA